MTRYIFTAVSRLGFDPHCDSRRAIYFSSQSLFSFLRPLASLLCLHSIAREPKSANPNKVPTATPTVTSPPTVGGGGDAPIPAAAVAFDVLTEGTVELASVTVLIKVIVVLLSSDVEPDVRSNMTRP